MELEKCEGKEEGNRDGGLVIATAAYDSDDEEEIIIFFFLLMLLLVLVLYTTRIRVAYNVVEHTHSYLVTRVYK